MPGLLISVRNAAEAGMATAGGCSVLDVKDPSAGALGRPSSGCLDEILACVEQIKSPIPASCALGELADWTVDPALMPVLNRLAYLKIGPAGLNQFDDWADSLASLQQEFLKAGVSRPRWVAAFYLDFEAADTFDPLARLDELVLREQICQRLGCAGILLDTFDKTGPSATELIFRSVRTQTLRKFVDEIATTRPADRFRGTVERRGNSGAVCQADSPRPVCGPFSGLQGESAAGGN